MTGLTKMTGLRVAVIGAGAVGARCARQLVSSPEVATVVVRDPNDATARHLVESLGSGAGVDPGSPGDPVDADVVVLAGPVGTQADQAAAFMRSGQHVVTTSDSVDEVTRLLAFDDEATERDVTVVAGAGFAPGLTDLLAAHAASWFEQVLEVHVAKLGTGGPACARAHHRALRSEAVDWRDGGWIRRPGGSGRELVWFPDPLAARDCYRAAAPDALLLVPALSGVQRVTSRVAATRRDRLTAALPMLRRPHADGGPGGVRVEVRGTIGQGHEVVVLGAMDRPAVAAGAVAAVAAVALGRGEARRRGVAGMAELFDPLPMLSDLAVRGVRCARFDPSAGPSEGQNLQD
jgi:hypothetical protein